MSDTQFLALAVVLISTVLFILSPRRYHHWLVLAFVGAVFVIVIIGLPHRLLLFLVVALLLWITGFVADRMA